MSKLHVQVRGKILQISFSYLHVREVLKVQVEADSLEKRVRSATLLMKINLHQEVSFRWATVLFSVSGLRKI